MSGERDTLLALKASWAGHGCATDHEAPCAEVASELEWPDDWCLPCYTRAVVDAALRDRERP